MSSLIVGGTLQRTTPTDHHTNATMGRSFVVNKHSAGSGREQDYGESLQPTDDKKQALLAIIYCLELRMFLGDGGRVLSHGSHE